MKKRHFYILIIFLLFHSLAHAYQDKKEVRFNFWPLFVYIKIKPEHTKILKILGPVFFEFSSKKEKIFSLRPLFSYIKTPKTVEFYFLSPLGKYQKTPSFSIFYLVPLAKRKVIKLPDQKKEIFNEFLLLFWGKTYENQTYGGFFPFFGNFKNRFGTQKIEFFFWPLYTRVDYQDHYTISYLWPFVKTFHTKPGSKFIYKGFKFFPFYGKTIEAWRETKFILFPFYIKEKNIKEKVKPFKRTIVFPFYIKEQTDLYTKTIYLWPFFQFIKAPKFKYEQIDAPWPFYRKIKGDKIQGFRLWPLYGKTVKPDYYHSFFLWPFYFFTRDFFVRGNTSYLRIEHRILLISKFARIYSNNTLVSRVFNLWPILNFKQTPQEKHFSFFEIIPVKERGMQENYAPIFRIFNYYKNQNCTLVNFLWGLYIYENCNQRKVNELGFLFRKIDDLQTDTHYIEFLNGLIGFGKIDGKKVFKLFFINF